MTRPLRLEFPGALYHVTSRGNRQNAIYRDDSDRRAWLDLLGLVCQRHSFLVHGFCQMTNHFHLLIETLEGNLSQGMRQLNGVYTQHYNHRHRLVGHLFQGRYKAILVQKESYLLELARYIVLNPVRANMVASPGDWQWSSHHYLVHSAHPPDWFARDGILGRFGQTRAEAILAYDEFVLEGMNKTSPLAATRHRILLGDDAFVAQHENMRPSEELGENPRAERRAVAPDLASYRDMHVDRNEAMARAYLSTAYTMPQIADAFGVSTKTVSRAVAAYESGCRTTNDELVPKCQT
ncbi:MAG: transposase [Pseudomonadota bacterium]